MIAGGQVHVRLAHPEGGRAGSGEDPPGVGGDAGRADTVGAGRQPQNNYNYCSERVRDAFRLPFGAH